MGSCLALRLTRPIRRLSRLAPQLDVEPLPAQLPASGLPEIDELAQTLWQSANRGHLVIERERAFSAQVAHQLRTPLASARAVAETELVVPRESPRTALLEVVSCLDRLEETTNQLLALARGFPEQQQPLPLTEIARRAQRRWAAEFEHSMRTLSTSLAIETSVAVRTIAFDQILDVLLDNALNHGSGSTKLMVYVDRDRLCVAVQDAGRIDEGIDPLTTRVRRGHGIGLAFASALARAEGWDLALAQPTPTRYTLTNHGTRTPSEPQPREGDLPERA